MASIESLKHRLNRLERRRAAGATRRLILVSDTPENREKCAAGSHRVVYLTDDDWNL